MSDVVLQFTSPSPVLGLLKRGTTVEAGAYIEGRGRAMTSKEMGRRHLLNQM